MLSRWRYLIFARRWQEAFLKARKPLSHTAYGFEIVLEPGVYPSHPDFTRSTSVVLARLPDDLRGKTVLDVGTGCGAIAIAAALRGAQVYTVDNEPRAVALARRNAAAQGVADRVTIRHGDLFDADLPDRFDYIAANLWFPIGLWGFNRDHQRLLRVQQRFLAQVTGRLAPGGQALLASGAFADVQNIRRLFAEMNIAPEVTVHPATHNGGKIHVDWHLYVFGTGRG